MDFHIVYPEKIPSPKARVTTVVHAASSLSKLCAPTLYCEALDGKALHAGYGVSFPKERVKTLSRRFLGLRSNHFFNARLWISLPKEGYIHVRHLKTAHFLLNNKRKGWKIIFEAHELFHKTTENHRVAKKLLAMERVVYAKADGITAISQTLAEEIRAHFSPKAPILYQPTGAQFPKSCPVKDFSKIEEVYYIGGLYPWKGVHTLIGAFSRVREPIKLKIVGGDSRERLDELRGLVERLGIGERVEFLPRMEQEQVTQLLAQKTRLCVLPNTHGHFERYSMPLKLFEYMAGGNIIVYSQIPSLQEVEGHGRIGVGYPPEDEQALADAINRIVADPDTYAPLAAEAFAVGKAHYGWDGRAQRLLDWAKAL